MLARCTSAVLARRAAPAETRMMRACVVTRLHDPCVVVQMQRRSRARAVTSTQGDGTLLHGRAASTPRHSRSPSRRFAARRRSPACARGARGGAMSRRSAAQKRANALGVLGLEEGASEEEIRKAYKREALHHHPDKNGARPPRSTRRAARRSTRRRLRASCSGGAMLCAAPGAPRPRGRIGVPRSPSPRAARGAAGSSQRSAQPGGIAPPQPATAAACLA